MSFESRLRKETPRWVAAGILTPEQARQVEALHPENEGASTRRFLAIVTMLGGALSVVGLALIISANWDDIHRWVKLGVFAVLLAGAYGLGARLLNGPNAKPLVGEALLTIGCALFISGIALVSQIYHLDGRAGDAVLLWIAGIAAVPLLTRTRGPFFVLLLAIYIWFSIEAAARDGRLALGSGISGGSEHALPFVLLSVALALYWTAAFWPAAWRNFATMQQAWSVTIVCATVYAAGFLHHGRMGGDGLPVQPALWFIALVLAAAVLAARRDFNAWRLISPWLLLAAIPAWLAWGGFFGGDARIAGAWLSSATLLALNVFMARAGLVLGRPWLVNLGVAFIALNLFTRYFDFFSSMLDQGMMFLVSGIVVLGIGWFLERKRRDLLAAIKRGGGS